MLPTKALGPFYSLPSASSSSWPSGLAARAAFPDSSQVRRETRSALCLELQPRLTGQPTGQVTPPTPRAGSALGSQPDPSSKDRGGGGGGGQCGVKQPGSLRPVPRWLSQQGGDGAARWSKCSKSMSGKFLHSDPTLPQHLEASTSWVRAQLYDHGGAGVGVCLATVFLGDQTWGEVNTENAGCPAG